VNPVFPVVKRKKRRKGEGENGRENALHLFRKKGKQNPKYF
jgi:hypothetical protein